MTYRNILNFVIKPEHLTKAFTPEFLRTANGYDAHVVMDQFVQQCPSPDWRDRVMYVDAKTYLTGLLVLEDKVSMAHGLETRVPLLDNELVDFLLDVPFEALCHAEVGKVLFREFGFTAENVAAEIPLGIVANSVRGLRKPFRWPNVESEGCFSRRLCTRFLLIISLAAEITRI